jgi:hypothetical protein
MPEPKKETVRKGIGRAVVSDSVRRHANDPFFAKQNHEAREALSKNRSFYSQKVETQHFASRTLITGD